MVSLRVSKAPQADGKREQDGARSGGGRGQIG